MDSISSSLVPIVMLKLKQHVRWWYFLAHWNAQGMENQKAALSALTYDTLSSFDLGNYSLYRDETRPKTKGPTSAIDGPIYLSTPAKSNSLASLVAAVIRIWRFKFDAATPKQIVLLMLPLPRKAIVVVWIPKSSLISIQSDAWEPHRPPLSTPRIHEPSNPSNEPPSSKICQWTQLERGLDCQEPDEKKMFYLTDMYSFSFIGLQHSIILIIGTSPCLDCDRVP